MRSTAFDRSNLLLRAVNYLTYLASSLRAGETFEVVTAGGRVLNVTALGDDPAEARDAAYAAADMIQFDGKQLRRDIALRAVERVAS